MLEVVAYGLLGGVFAFAMTKTLSAVWECIKYLIYLFHTFRYNQLQRWYPHILPRRKYQFRLR